MEGRKMSQKFLNDHLENKKTRTEKIIRKKLEKKN